MRKFRFILGLLLISAGLSAQQSLLVFMEASEKKPFYVRLGSKTNASSATGQVYITELNGSAFEIFVGFPETEIPEQRFQITLKKNDNSFQLKSGSGQGWTLIDLESSQTIQASGAPVKPIGSIGGVKKTDAFAIMMAGVVNDTAVLYTSVITPEAVVDQVPQAPKTLPPSTSAPSTTPALPKADQGLATGVATEVASTEKNRVTAAPDSSKKHIDSSLAQRKTEKRTEKSVDSLVAVPRKPVSIDSPAKQTTPPVVVKNDVKNDLKTDSVTADANASAKKEMKADSVIVKADAPAKKDVKTDSVIAKTDVPAKKDSVLTTIVKPDLPANSPPKKDSLAKEVAAFPRVLKISEKKTEREVVLAYTDKSADGKMDTIHITIPVDPVISATRRKDSVKRWDSNPRPLRDSVVAKADSVRKPAATPAKTDSLQKSTSGMNRKDSVQKPASPVWNTDSNRKANAAIVKKDSSGKASPVNDQTVSKAPVMINSDCVNFATEYDLDKLRVKMVDEVTAEDRIAAAKKIFRTKCFTTRQIRALTELFLNDEGKYKFLDAAYPFVSDSHEFRKLVEVLKEDYYVKRFNAMIRS